MRGGHGLDLAQPHHVRQRASDGCEVSLGRRAKVPQPERERPEAERARAQVLLELADLTTLERHLRPGRVLSEDGLSLLGPHASSTADGSRRDCRSRPARSPPNVPAITRRVARSQMPCVRSPLAWSRWALCAASRISSGGTTSIPPSAPCLASISSPRWQGRPCGASWRSGRSRNSTPSKNFRSPFSSAPFWQEPVDSSAATSPTASEGGASSCSARGSWSLPGRTPCTLRVEMGGPGRALVGRGVRLARGSTSQAMVADLVAPDRREAAYASVRVASNLGVVAGPPIGGLVLLIASWPALFPTVAVLSAIAFFVAFRYLPHRGDFSPEGPPERGSLRVILRDRPFLLFLGSAVFAWLVYVAYEIVLPVSLVDGFGYEPAAWGFLVWINPLLVTLFQLRLTRATAYVAPAPKLVTGLLVMGLPYLLLVYSHAVWAVIVVVVIFVIGEMLWVPTSQSVVASLAPRDIRGAYMGAFGSAPAIGFALSPLIGLQGPKQLRGRCDLDDVRLPRDRRGRPRWSCTGDGPPTYRAADGLRDVERSALASVMSMGPTRGPCRRSGGLRASGRRDA